MTDSSVAISPAAPGIGASDLLNGSPAPAAPAWQPAGMPVAPPAFRAPEAAAARATIEQRKGDKDFYKAMVAERERGVMGPASQEWAALHKTGYPSPPAIQSQADIDQQATGRNAEMWNSYIADLKTRFPLTEQQEAEIRSGIVDEKSHKWAQEEKARLIKDRAFYRRYLDGDRAAIKDWGLLTSLLALRPVKRA
jgi:hypothetical protein